MPILSSIWTLASFTVRDKNRFNPKEYALIEYFLRNPERVIPKVELAEKVWEIDFVTNTNVIEVYMNYLRNKMDKGYDKN